MADYTLAPAPYQTVLDTAGAPVPNACIWTYVAGTTTPAATYSDHLGTPNTNPIRADSAGRWTAYLTPGAGYQFVFETPCSPPSGHGAVIRTADNVVGGPAMPPVTTGTWTPSLSPTTTYTAREGTYLRVGRLVFARGSLTIATPGTGGSILSGLPCTCASQVPVLMGYFDTLLSAVSWLGGITNALDTTLTILSTPGPVVTASTLPVLGAGSVLFFSVVYDTADP